MKNTQYPRELSLICFGKYDLSQYRWKTSNQSHNVFSILFNLVSMATCSLGTCAPIWLFHQPVQPAKPHPVFAALSAVGQTESQSSVACAFQHLVVQTKVEKKQAEVSFHRSQLCIQKLQNLQKLACMYIWKIKKATSTRCQNQTSLSIWFPSQTVKCLTILCTVMLNRLTSSAKKFCCYCDCCHKLHLIKQCKYFYLKCRGCV